MAHPGGRPTKYTEELASIICHRIMDGESLKKIVNHEKMPTRSTVHLWLSKNKKFSDKYAKARDSQADTYADEITDISDEAHDRDTAAAAKVRVDARKWVASKLKPKKYSDKLDLNANIDGKLTIQTVDYSNANPDDTV